MPPKRKPKPNQPVVRLIPINIEECSMDKPKIQTSVESPGEMSGCREENEEIIESTPPAQNEINLETLTLSGNWIGPYAAPEKIIIVFDPVKDESSEKFKLADGRLVESKEMLAQAVGVFVQNKHLINEKHQFAVTALTPNAFTPLSDFTSNPEEVMKVLDSVEECEAEDQLDMNKLFDLVGRSVEVERSGDEDVSPEYVVRVVFLYSRSYTLPIYEETGRTKRLLESPYFVFDVCMNHEQPSEANKAEEIFRRLQGFNRNGLGYYFSVNRCPKKLFSGMARLLGHPLQRARQGELESDVEAT